MKNFTVQNFVESFVGFTDSKIYLRVRFGTKLFQISGRPEKFIVFCNSVNGYTLRIARAEIEMISQRPDGIGLSIRLSDYTLPSLNTEFIDALLEDCEKFNLSVAG